jgi:hypothetical protein
VTKLDDAYDAIVIDDPLTEPKQEPVENRTPTRPIKHHSIEVDLADGESVAAFLEVWAHLVRSKKKFKIIIE